LPAADEHLDSIPMTTLDQSHVFVSYENLPHDIWHAAYGTYCTVLTTYKTVQYEWLLRQSLDGAPFVDPRDSDPIPQGGTAGTGGVSGGTGGTGGSDGGSAGTTVVMAGTGGTAGTATTDPPAMGGTPPAAAPRPASANQESGCSIAPGASTDPRSGSHHSALWLSLLAGLFVVRSRRQRSVGGVVRAPAVRCSSKRCRTHTR
jgi:MYXO-CTERM domain-containing protein